MQESEIEGKRIRLKNARKFFAMVKTSAKDISWKNLVVETGCSNTSLKAYRRGDLTIPGKTFLVLLNYLGGIDKELFLDEAENLPNTWGTIKAGKQAIQNRKIRLGEEGFLKYMKNTRECSEFSGFAGWHKKMKLKNPELYFQIQKKRWLSYLKLCGNGSHNNRPKALQTLQERYGLAYFTFLGLSGAAGQKLTEREKIVKNEIDKLGFDIKPHKTIFENNFDFAFEKEGELKAVEEVLGFRKKKGSLFFDILSLYEKYKSIRKKYAVPFFVSTWSKVDLGHKFERTPLELLIWALEKGIIPILQDCDFFNETRKNALFHEDSEEPKILEFLKNDLDNRKTNLRKGALAQLRQPFDGLEKASHEKLIANNLPARGKKLFKTKYGTFTVADNYFEINGRQFAVFVSRSDINGVIGSAALVKELVSPTIKTIGIVLSRKCRHETLLQKTLLKTYVDYFYDSLDAVELLGP